MIELKETVEWMGSENYRERFLAEYWQTKIRYEKLKAYINKIEVAELMGWVEPPHICPKELLREQQRRMGEYLSVLEKRAIIEQIELSDGKENVE